MLNISEVPVDAAMPTACLRLWLAPTTVAVDHHPRRFGQI
jgi:hypothetical protein